MSLLYSNFVWHSFENAIKLNAEGQSYEVGDTALKECVQWEEAEWYRERNANIRQSR
jgi:hypothetical protein